MLPVQTELTAETVVLEGSVLVNIEKPGNEKNFYGYANNVIFPIIKPELIKVERVDLVFDTYQDDGLKSTTRAKRVKGIRRKVETNFETPKNWRSFCESMITKVSSFVSYQNL